MTDHEIQTIVKSDDDNEITQIQSLLNSLETNRRGVHFTLNNYRPQVRIFARCNGETLAILIDLLIARKYLN